MKCTCSGSQTPPLEQEPKRVRIHIPHYIPRHLPLYKRNNIEPLNAKMFSDLVIAAALGLLLFIVIAWFTYQLANDRRRRVNFAVQEAMRDEPSALVFGSHAPLPIRSINEPPRAIHVAEPIIPRTLRSDQRINDYTSGYQVPNRARGYSAGNEQPGVMRVEVYPVQESPRGYKGTSVRV